MYFHYLCTGSDFGSVGRRGPSATNSSLAWLRRGSGGNQLSASLVERTAGAGDFVDEHGCFFVDIQPASSGSPWVYYHVTSNEHRVVCDAVGQFFARTVVQQSYARALRGGSQNR